MKRCDDTSEGNRGVRMKKIATASIEKEGNNISRHCCCGSCGASGCLCNGRCSKIDGCAEKDPESKGDHMKA